jgi:hypothetical protein
MASLPRLVLEADDQVHGIFADLVRGDLRFEVKRAETAIRLSAAYSFGSR